MFNIFRKKFLFALMLLLISTLALFACDKEIDKHSLIEATGFSIKSDTGFCKVPNSTETFSFIDKISVSKNATWTISTDINGENVIPTKTISLDIGDNIVFLLVTSQNGNDISLYTLTIRRKPIYEISFNMNGGTTVEIQYIEEDSYAEQPTIDALRTGYIFSDWNFDFEIPITENTIITPIWQTVTYTINYANLLSAVNPNSILSYTIESDSITFSLPQRTGYTGSWDISSIPKGSTGNKIITAVWSLIEYNITYENLQGGINSNNIKSYTIESDSITFLLPQRTGYTGSWDISGIPKGSIGNKVVTAAWTAKKYKVKFDVSGGELDETEKEIEFDSEYQLISPTHSYYTFGGWYTKLGGGGTLYNNSGVWTTTSNITLYVYWLGTSNLNYTLIDGNYMVSNGTANTNDEIYIPPYYNGKAVTSIDNYAFDNCSSITSIKIPDSVTRIGHHAFTGCSSLNSITIPKGVTSIEYETFNSCSNLTSIEIPEKVTNIGSSAFMDCSSLTNISISEFITKIGSNAFYKTGYYYNINNWKNDALYIGKYLIDVKTSLSGSYAIKQDTLIIGDFAFYKCNTLTSITIPNSVKSIGDWAFRDCNSITNIIIPNSVTSIGGGAFHNCSIIANIEIGDSVTRIGGSAFSDCSSLVSITINSFTPPSFGIYMFNSTSSELKIYVPIESVNAYKSANGWSDYEDKIFAIE